MVMRSPDGTRARWRWIVLVMVVLALATVVLLWFQPQKLLFDEQVDDALPVAPAPEEPDPEGSTPAGSRPAESRPQEPVDLYRGEFASRDHATSGTVRVVELVDGRRIVRLEGLDTDNGPDLYLYLSANAADGAEGAFDDTFVSLGRLQGNLGNQNYDLPEGVDPAQYQSVVIWCDRFDSAFGAAALRAT